MLRLPLLNFKISLHSFIQQIRPVTIQRFGQRIQCIHLIRIKPETDSVLFHNTESYHAILYNISQAPNNLLSSITSSGLPVQPCFQQTTRSHPFGSCMWSRKFLLSNSNSISTRCIRPLSMRRSASQSGNAACVRSITKPRSQASAPNSTITPISLVGAFAIAGCLIGSPYSGRPSITGGLKVDIEMAICVATGIPIQLPNVLRSNGAPNDDPNGKSLAPPCACSRMIFATSPHSPSSFSLSIKLSMLAGTRLQLLYLRLSGLLHIPLSMLNSVIVGTFFSFLAVVAQLIKSSIIGLRHAAIRLNPYNAAARTVLGGALFAKGDPDAAIAEYRAALRSDANSVLAHYLLGIALYGKRDLAGAYSELQAALKLNPNFGGVYKMLGAVLEGSRRLAWCA